MPHAGTVCLWLVVVLALVFPAAVEAKSKRAASKPKEVVETVVSGTVAEVYDGDTFELTTGERVRLLDINTPEVSHNGEPAHPLGPEAGEALRQMVAGKVVELRIGRKKKDIYDRTLAHVWVNGIWVNRALVEQGFAHVYSFPDNRMKAKELLPVEDAARAQKKGIWALPRWQVHGAETCCRKEDIGRFGLVEGTVKRVTRVGERVFFNFGDDYRTDFTFFIGAKDEKAFKKDGITDVETAYAGKRVLIRGFLEPVNGVQVHVTHPEQIEVDGER